MAVNNLLRLVLNWSGYQEIGTTSWHFAGSVATHTPSELSDALDAIVNNWQTATTPSPKDGLLDRITTSQTYTSLDLYEYAVDNEPATTMASKSLGWVGTVATATIPSLQLAQVATLRTDLAGRRHRGRQYFPCMHNTIQLASARFPNAQADTLATLASNLGLGARDEIANTLSIAALDWAVYSRVGRSATVITSVTVDNKPDTQRRRANSLQATYTATANLP